MYFYLTYVFHKAVWLLAFHVEQSAIFALSFVLVNLMALIQSYLTCFLATMQLV